MKAADRIKEIKSYYFANKLAQIEQMNQSGAEVINLGIGSPDIDPPEIVSKVLENAVNEDGAHQYQSYRGIKGLRTAFSNWYKNHFKVDLSADHEILPLIGSKEGIMHISMAFLNPGDQVLISNPGYPAYKSISIIAGATPINYNLSKENNWLPDFDELEKLDLTKVKIMWVNYPHMPSGATASLDLFQKLVDFGKKHKILICHDNPYTFILNDEPVSIFQADGAKESALELTSLSKNYNMSGWRVGAVAGKKEWLDIILTFKSNMDSGMFKPIQEAAIAALNIEEGWFEELNATYRNRREAVWQIMDELGCEYDRNAAGLFVWAKVPDGFSGVDMSDNILEQAKVFITPGFIFGTQGESYIRASLCAPIETIHLAHGRIKNAIKDIL